MVAGRAGQIKQDAALGHIVGEERVIKQPEPIEPVSGEPKAGPIEPVSDDATEFISSDEILIENDAAAKPPITELDIRMIAASLHDHGRGYVLPDMIEGMTGVRPPNDDFSPRKMPIRDPEWRRARKKTEQKKYRAKRRAHMTDEEKAKRIGNLQLWRDNNPEKMRAAETRRLEKKKAGRRSRQLVAVDLEGFDTGRYFTDDRRDYAREFHEGIALGKELRSKANSN